MSKRISFFTQGDLRFPVKDSGPLDGPPVLLLHGWPQDGSSWRAVAAKLNEAGYRTFAPTLRGGSVGASPRARAAYRGSELRRDVAAMVAQIGGPVHLVGHDWGAALAWNVATHDPDLLLSLTAVSVPHPATFLKSLVTSAQGLSSWYMYLFQLPVIPELVLGSRPVMTRALVGTGQSETAAHRDVERSRTWPVRRGGLNWYRGAVLEPFDPGTPTPVPVLQVWSDGDKAIRRHCIDRAGHHAAGEYRLVVLHGVSHWIPDEAPDLLAQELIAHVQQAETRA